MPTRSTVSATLLDPVEGMGVEGQTDSGFRIRFDTLASADGGVGAGPTETVLVALAACTAMDVASILRKKRQPFRSYQINVIADKADEHPQVYTTIIIEHQLAGEMTAESVRRSIELSATTYCPVSAMLSAAVRIEHRYRIRREGETEEASALVVVTGPQSGPGSGPGTGRAAEGAAIG
jgi:putative redox protein